MPVHVDPVRNMKRKYEEDHFTPSTHSKPGKITLLDPKFMKSVVTKESESGERKRRRTNTTLHQLKKRDVINILKEAEYCMTNGNIQQCSTLLREFSVDHLSTLSEQNYVRCAEMLMKMGRKTIVAEIGKLVMRMVHSIMERMEKRDVIEIIPILINEKMTNDGKTRPFIESAILGILEGMIRRGFIDNLSSISPYVTPILIGSVKDMHDPMKRREVIRYRVASVVMGVEGAESSRTLQLFLCESTKDRDVRVRMAALEGLMEVKELHVENYSSIKELCGDSQSRVRIATLKLVQRFAISFPNQDILIPSSSSSLISSRMNLSDDAFSIVCHAVNDMEVDVRSLAVSLLGDFEVVTESYLDQTLDKKLMKMKTTDSGAKIGVRTKESLFAIRKIERRRDESEWASGKELNEVAAGEKRKMKKEEDRIMNQGACGAFITALEDEFMCVRKAAVYSLGKLASTRPSFAATALDHLADMFNDEIEEVRLDSIKALTPLVTRGELFKEQLETIIKCLDDATPVSRSALRKLLEKAKFADIECIRICVRSLLFCMKRYPMDKNEIMETMASLGRCHSSLVHPLVNQLLDIHPIFASQEKSLQDDQYVAKLVLVLNAASQFEPVVSLLPPYVKRHFRYMRCALKEFVPMIDALESREKGEAERTLSQLREKWTGSKGDVLEEVYSRLVEVQKIKDSEMRRKMRKYIVEDLEAFSSFNVSLASPSRLLTSIVYLLNSIDRSPLDSLTPTGDANEIHKSIDKELWGLGCIEEGIAGLPLPIVAFLVESRLHLLIYQWMVSLHLRPLSYRSVMEHMKEEINYIQSRFSSSSLIQSSSSQQLTTSLSYLVHSGKVISNQMLIDLILKNPPSLPSSINNTEIVRVKWAKIIEPEKDISMERPHRFVSILPTCTNFVAEVHELEESDRERIRIKIDYPDGSVTLFRPRVKDMSEVEDKVIKIRTNVLLAVSSSWSDSADVTLSIVLLPPSHSPSTLPIPLSSSPSSYLPSSVTIKIQPMVSAGGQQNVTGVGVRPGMMLM